VIIIVAVRASSLRRVDVPPLRVSVPVRLPARRWSAASARAGARVVVGAIAFLSSYAALQVGHATGHDPPLVGALLPIPLYARFVVCVALATPVGLAAGALVAARPRLLAKLPALLAATIAVAVAGVVLFP
jgi:hypothetical protein